MTVFGVTMVKNEEDIIGPVIEHMVGQVDHVIVADNMSTDSTRSILDGFDITIINDKDPAYTQSLKMTRLALLARDQGADWVIPFDADEVWIAPGTIKSYLEKLETFNVVEATMYNHYKSDIDTRTGNPLIDMPYRYKEQNPLPKVAVKPLEGLNIHMGNHGVDFFVPQFRTGGIVVHHYPYRSVEQFVSKVKQGAAALKKTDYDYSVGQHWRDYANILEAGGEAAIEELFYTYFYYPHDEMVYDPCIQ